MMERAFVEAFATQGIVPGTAAYAHCMVGVHRARGQSPVDVFRNLFPGVEGRAEAAALSFERSFRAAVDRTGMSPFPGAEQAIGELRDAGVRVCLVTSLSQRLVSLVLETLGWDSVADLTLCRDDAPRGFPWPDLAFTAMLRLGVEDVQAAAFAAGTASGIQCGRRAGAGLVAGVLTGGHTRDRLRAAGATHLIEGIAQLPALLLGSGARDAGGAAPAAPAESAPGGHAARAPAPGHPASSARALSPQVPLDRRNSGL